MSQEDEGAHLKTRGMVDQLLPPIPAKRYFTIGEVSELCAVKPHVLRYWEQEFTQLRQMKRRGNRRYYQHHEVLLIHKIRELLYDEGFTIQGARMRLSGRQTISNLQAEAAAVARLQLAEQAELRGLKEAGSLEKDVGLATDGTVEKEGGLATDGTSEKNVGLAKDANLEEPGSPGAELVAPPEQVLTVPEIASDGRKALAGALNPAALEQLRQELTEALRLLSIA